MFAFILFLIRITGSTPVGGYGSPPPAITFDRFVRYVYVTVASCHCFDRSYRACVVVKELTEAFRKIDRDNDGWIQISYDQFMGIFLHAP